MYVYTTLGLIMHLYRALRDRLETRERDLIWPSTKRYAFTYGRGAHDVNAIIIIIKKVAYCAFVRPSITIL